ncbi:MAG: hypothetical protein E7774_05075 [Bradyrhizobium sp.]|nr:MAG: hypothetical protein E7774_05075 [Bradyrhizobium sp.]
MTKFVSVKTLAGFNFVRADSVMAVATAEQTKCNIYMAGGVMVSSAETAKDVVARLDAAMNAQPVPEPEAI